MSDPVVHNKTKAVELWGYQKGQVVTITTCNGKYRQARGTFVFVSVTIDNGTPVEVDVYGGPRNKEKLRTFPIERLEPPKRKYRKRGVDKSQAWV